MDLVKYTHLPDALCLNAYFDPNLSDTRFDQSPLWYHLLGQYGLDSGTPEYYRFNPAVAASCSAWLPMLKKPADTLFACNRLVSFSNYYTSAFAPIVPQPLNHQYLAAVLKGLVEQNPDVDWFEINLLQHGSSLYQAVLNGFQTAGLWVQPYFRFGNWCLELNGRSFGDYAETLPSRLRHTIARKRRKLDREASWQIDIATQGAALESALSAYEYVYTTSWKQAESHPEFIRQFVLQSARLHGWPRIGVLSIADQPIAAQLWFIKDQRASIFKLVYDQAFGHYSPGSILTLAMMEAAITGDAVKTVDYLTGDDAYKQDWMQQRYERWAIRAFNPGRVKGLFASANSLGRAALRARIGRRTITQ